MIQDLEDNYTDFLDDTLGYAWDVWDVVALGEIDQHDHAFEEGVRGGELATDANDLIRWGYARGRRKADELASFLEHARIILNGERSHVAVAYEEIFTVVALTSARQEDVDGALTHLARARELFGEQPEFDRVEANIEFIKDREHGLKSFRETHEKHPDDAEFAFDLAEDLLLLGEWDDANWFAEKIASLCTPASAIWVDLQSLKRRIIEGRTSA